ncbi:hypothetical protein Q0F98_38585 [Paenibacillus amylolyticus]|nr:hypothetical protein Q0F98_38585 [Paenibacillus amylolyticus]
MEKGLTLVKNVKWSENLFDLTIDQATGLIVSIESAGTDVISNL